MFFKLDRLFISAIAILTLVFYFTGCSDKRETKAQKIKLEETEVNMTELTYEKVEELNKKSHLLGVTLLDAPPSDMIMPGPEPIGTGDDYYNCFLFDGKNRITQVGLVSESAEVLGIAVGDSLARVEDVLVDEGFRKLEAKETKALINKNEKAVAYQVGYLTLIFYVEEKESVSDDAIITKMLINIDNPAEEKPTF